MRKQSIAIGICCTVLGLVALYLTRVFPPFRVRGVELPGPAFFPNLVAYALLICGGAEFAAGYRKQGPRNSPEQDAPEEQVSHTAREAFVSALVVVGSVIAYGILHEKLGFLVTTVILSTTAMRQFKVKLGQAILASVVVTVVLALIFARLLRVPLPTGVISFW